MARFSTVFELGNSQASLDFVDVDLTTDTNLYIDPYAIQIRKDAWSAKCGDSIRSFFSEVLNALRQGEQTRALHFLSQLREPNETFLGQSAGHPSGRGVGDLKAKQFAEALIASRAFQTGVIADISEAELFIRGVGPDTISDLTTNIIRGHLADYTKEQCELNNIPTTVVRMLGPVWDNQTLDWISKDLNLPVYNGRPILLVPKSTVRFKLSLDSQEFYNHYMLEYLKQEYLNSGHSLVQTLKNGDRRVTKTSVKERHPFVKDNIAQFVIDHPDILEMYKKIKGASGPLSIEEFQLFFDEQAYSEALIQKLRQITPGDEEASKYHRHALGITTFLFHPSLITPIKEHELHYGRKRIDIRFTNAAVHGFFHTMLASAQTRALTVVVECKNYRTEIRNNELDQLTGRFGHQRGFFGMLLCRSMENRTRVIASCGDSANDGRGYMLVLEDEDLIHMLNCVKEDNRPGVEAFLYARFQEISG